MHNLPFQKLKELSNKWLSGTISAKELELLESWYNQQPDAEIKWPAGDVDEEQLKERLLYNINNIQKAGAPVRPLYKRAMLYQVAAILLLALSISLYYLPVISSKRVADVGKLTKKNLLPPNSNQAVLTLANGRKVVLDSAGNGLVAKQGNTQINKTQDGKLVYNSDATGIDAAPQINTINTPAGGKYQITLPDGSKVWLNALTALKFPTVFTGKERVVELDGEAYFEVAKNKAMPFKVKMANNTSIQVLGTHFNIMAYNNERSINATLLEGSINVQKDNQSKLMAPGQQAVITDRIDLKTVNVDASVAWTNGLFSFDNTDVCTVLRQIERWYGVEVEYKGLPNHQITGYISRSSNLIEVIKMLELSGVKLTIEGKKIKVFSN